MTTTTTQTAPATFTRNQFAKMKSTKETFALRTQNGNFYTKRGKPWETRSYALACAMCVIAEKETNQKFTVVTR